MFALAPAAVAAPPAASETEIVVYGDDFARWDHTRWWLEAELALPSGLALEADQNLGLHTHAFQVRAVIACEKDARLSAKRWEVSCAIDDLALRVTTATEWRSEASRARVQTVLDEIDDRLTGARVQMQTADDGAIVDFDLEGVDADNARERASHEALRSLVTLMMGGFHLRIPDHAQRDGEWVETHTELMDIPSLTAAHGSSRVVHRASDHEGDRIVQSVGQGTMAVASAFSGTDPFTSSKLVQGDGTDTTLKQTTMQQLMPEKKFDPNRPAFLGILFPAPPQQAPTETNLGTTSTSGARPRRPPAGDRVETTVEAVYETELASVAVFETATGILTERVWVCAGAPSSTSGVASGPYLNVGRLWRLAPDERPDVGPSAQVAWPGHAMEGLEPWPATGPGAGPR